MTSKFNYIKKGVKYIIGAAVLATGLSSAAFGLNQDNDGYYQIGSSKDLREFAEKVNNEGENDAKGKLMNDIVFNEGLIENGKLKEGGNFEEWIPIGTEESPYIGEFIGDGEIKTITGLYINNENNYQGLFGVIGEGGKIRDIEVNGSYIKGKDFVGGIAGLNKGEIKNCITGIDSMIEGETTVGGNVGCACGKMMEDCQNIGKVKGKVIVGGNVGRVQYIESIKCNNSGEVTGEWKVGGNIGWDITIKTTGECKNEGKVKGDYSIGGNIGCINYAKLIQCNNNGVVNGKNNVGGNVGDNNNNEMLKIEGKNNGNVQGKKCVGGNIGINQKEIETAHLNNDGKIEGEYYVGGNIGHNRGKGIKEKGTYLNDGKVEGTSYVGGNIGKNDAIMKGRFGKNSTEDVYEVIGKEHVGRILGDDGDIVA